MFLLKKSLACAGVLMSMMAGAQLAPVAEHAVKPTVVTDTVVYDTDDPAIWINPKNPAGSMIIGTDKDSDGGLYLFNLQGKLLKRSIVLQRPNNVDIAYGFVLNGKPVDIAVTTERETNKIRIFSMPTLDTLDNGGIDVFAGEAFRAPMGIALYTRPKDHAIFAIVGRKTGPADGYLFQYRLRDDGKGHITADLVRSFGKYSGLKEIEAIAVDNEPGYVYYSDEKFGVHQYHADPDAADKNELALFGTTGFKSDHEGISIYKTGAATGYILVSNQQSNSFMVFTREGSAGRPFAHRFITEIPVSAVESDGSDVTAMPLGKAFPKGMFVAMSNGRVFHYYDWRRLQARIDAAAKAKKTK